MTEDEANAALDRICLKRYGKTYATDADPLPGGPSATAADSPDDRDSDTPDSLASIRRDYPSLFPSTPTDPSA
jgi:hypothetical protein